MGMSPDWWMVYITSGSVLVSAVLAWLAYRNGRKAIEIAADASDRDEAHRAREVDQREREERAHVALAMMRAVSAAEAFESAQNPAEAKRQETVAEIEKEMVRSRSEALAHVELYATAEEDEELRPWIDSALHAIAYPRRVGADRFQVMDYLYFARRAIRLWNLREVTSGQIIVGKLPPEIELDDEAPVPSA